MDPSLLCIPRISTLKSFKISRYLFDSGLFPTTLIAATSCPFARKYCAMFNTGPPGILFILTPLLFLNIARAFLSSRLGSSPKSSSSFATIEQSREYCLLVGKRIRSIAESATIRYFFLFSSVPILPTIPFPLRQPYKK